MKPCIGISQSGTPLKLNQLCVHGKVETTTTNWIASIFNHTEIKTMC